jgi:Ca2+-binding EF-hand superfamily protein
MEKNEEKLSTEDLELLFDETDRDKDGTIDFKDFMRMMMSK